MSSPYRLTTQWPRRRTSTSDLPLLPIYVPSNQELPTDSTSTPPQYKSSFTTDVEASPNKYTERKRIDSLASEPSTPGSWLENSRRTMYVNWSLFSGTIIFCVLTIAYAINASLKKPASRGLIANDPQLTIAILSGMSSLSAFLLAELVQAVFERVRWVLASRPNGLLLTEFLGMSRATSIAGVIALLAWRVNSQTSGILGRLGGSRGLWIFQRYIASVK